MDDRVVALAGVLQAARLVHTISTTGTAERDAMDTSIASIFTLDAQTVADCYGGDLSGLRTGFEALAQNLGGKMQAPEILRYAFTLLHIERRVSGRPAVLAEIRAGIEAAERQVEQLGPTHENVLARLNEVYSGTISKLTPRVMVQGKPLFLQQDRCVAEIRSLLLAGLRSAVLWAQLGGRRWHLLFTRKRVAAEAERIVVGLGSGQAQHSAE